MAAAQPSPLRRHRTLRTPRRHPGTARCRPAAHLGRLHPPTRHDAETRAQASRRLLQLLHNLDPPCFVCGDFNQPPHDWLPTASPVAPSPAVPTYPTPAPTEPIDYCLLHGATGQAHIVPSLASDHLPLLITVDSVGFNASGTEALLQNEGAGH